MWYILAVLIIVWLVGCCLRLHNEKEAILGKLNHTRRVMVNNCIKVVYYFGDGPKHNLVLRTRENPPREYPVADGVPIYVPTSRPLTLLTRWVDYKFTSSVASNVPMGHTVEVHSGSMPVGQNPVKVLPYITHS
jgi:hypothetical protein